jgi:HAD superfamily hydrolase (TIGR01549 family)
MVVSRVFLDFADTLAKDPINACPPSRVWVGVAQDFRLQFSEPTIRMALEAVDQEIGPTIYQYVGRTDEYWQLYNGRVMDRLRIKENREGIGRAVEKIFEDPSRVELFPETRAVLVELRSLGYHLGLISDFTDHLLKLLEYHQLDTLFETVTYSQEVGVEKPAPEIFLRALRRANCSAADAVHVGNSVPHDVEGAQRCGLGAIWLNRERRPRSVNCPMIHSLDELRPTLELMNRRAESQE